MEDETGLDAGHRHCMIGLGAGLFFCCSLCTEIRHVCMKFGCVCMNFIWLIQLVVKMYAASVGWLPPASLSTDGRGRFFGVGAGYTPSKG